MEIEVRLGTGEIVHIDWYGPHPVIEDLTAFLEDQFPGSDADIFLEYEPVQISDEEWAAFEEAGA